MSRILIVTGLAMCCAVQPGVSDSAPARVCLETSHGSIILELDSVAAPKTVDNSVDNGFLDHTGKTPDGWGYCVFGKVVEGMEVVDAIEGVPTTNRAGHQDVPDSPVTINQATVVE